MEPEQILALPMQENDAGASTIGGYLQELLMTVWEEGEGFSGKRPFGNSGWEGDLYIALIKGGAVRGRIDEDGYLETMDSDDQDAANHMIFEAIEYAFSPDRI